MNFRTRLSPINNKEKAIRHLQSHGVCSIRNVHAAMATK